MNCDDLKQLIIKDYVDKINPDFKEHFRSTQTVGASMPYDILSLSMLYYLIKLVDCPEDLFIFPLCFLIRNYWLAGKELEIENISYPWHETLVAEIVRHWWDSKFDLNLSLDSVELDPSEYAKVLNLYAKLLESLQVSASSNFVLREDKEKLIPKDIAKRFCAAVLKQWLNPSIVFVQNSWLWIAYEELKPELRAEGFDTP